MNPVSQSMPLRTDCYDVLRTTQDSYAPDNSGHPGSSQDTPQIARSRPIKLGLWGVGIVLRTLRHLLFILDSTTEPLLVLSQVFVSLIIDRVTALNGAWTSSDGTALVWVPKYSHGM